MAQLVLIFAIFSNSSEFLEVLKKKHIRSAQISVVQIFQFCFVSRVTKVKILQWIIYVGPLWCGQGVAKLASYSNYKNSISFLLLLLQVIYVCNYSPPGNIIFLGSDGKAKPLPAYEVCTYHSL